MDSAKQDRVKNEVGFIAALDQSGGSTPKVLKLYGIEADAYPNQEVMLDLVHEMRTRIIISPSFADPYSSWQRGTNEHHNGKLRRYYPKGTDFSHLSEEELQAAVTEINNQPRKCLGWFTPAEAFDEHLHLETTGQCCTSK
ncbi:hypothetical protein FEF26_15285 [Nesterenkonia salmonea]|uniref:IS30 family transposase n=1 Tax=Nesterenkonia salmonea TaxID=1804987 RepID=A0A5R9B2W2_9MICC|nr:hypothetical protein FEF26_15285 [Nesterenkonia salmonea]